MNQKRNLKLWKTGGTIEEPEQSSYSFDEILGLSFKLLLNTDYYVKQNGIWVNKEKDDKYMKEKIDDAESINVVGIIKKNPDTVSVSMTEGIGYTSELEEYVINRINEYFTEEE